LGTSISVHAQTQEAGPAGTQQAAVYRFDIPAQPLSDALRAFAQASGQQVSFDGAALQGVTARPLNGEYTAEEALRRLLQGTSIDFRRGRQGVWMVGPLQPAAQATGRQTSPAASTGADGEAAELDRIMVTGTRLRGVVDLSQPSISMTRDEIDRAGFNTVEELVEKLPGNFNILTPVGRGGALLSSNPVASDNYVRATAIDLRGLGAESTLTLINGRRRAGSVFGRVVDVSAIPISAIDRVDVVTGGASAIYGADAVAGVVNILTRRDIDGGETRFSFGSPTGYGGGEILKASHAQGFSSERGSLVVAYDYEQRWASNLLDTGHAELGRLPNGRRFTYQFLEADVRRHSAYVAGQLQLGDRSEFYGDVFYTHKDVEKQEQTWFNSTAGAEASAPSFGQDSAPVASYGGAAGVKIDVDADWVADIGASYSVTDARHVQYSEWHFVDPSSDFLYLIKENPNKSEITTFTAMADGSLPDMFGITPRLAFGSEFRKEAFIRVFQRELSDPQELIIQPPDRHVRAAFTELRLPFGQSTGGLPRTELSLGGRYDDYSDFGGTFNWTSGLIWRPADGLTLRGSYSTAFRPPALWDVAGNYSGTPDALILGFMEGPDPAAGSATTPILITYGQSAPLGPEEAKTWTASIDYAPTFAPWAKLTASYFAIDYDNRIIGVGSSLWPLWLEFETALASLTTRNPTAAQLQSIIDARTLIPDAYTLPDGTVLDAQNITGQGLLDLLPGLVVGDARVRNLSTETLRGMDFQFDANFDTENGQIFFGVRATKTFDHERKLTPTAEGISQIDRTFFPTSLRLRGNAGWSRGAFGADFFVNYTPGYDNPFPPPTGVPYEPTVSSWTTVDLTLRYEIGYATNSAWLDGLGVSLAISNLFDRDPPFWSGTASAGRYFDTANASPVGRFVTINFTKRW